MKSPYISELQPNQVVTATLLVQHKDIRQKKTGEPYLFLVLGDRTGEIEAKMWDNVAEVMDSFERNDFLRVRGLLQVVQNRLHLSLHRLQRQPEESIDFSDYFPASSRNSEEMYSELREIVSGMNNHHLRTLLTAVLDDAEFARRFKLAPAAKSVHHAWLGGLLEHVLSMCCLARLIGGHYPDVDLDLLLAGVILHDAGKIHELTYDRSFGYSTEGQLLGHIMLGLQMIDRKIQGVPDFPPRLRTLLEHMILSHHGELEFGSPKVPLFTEALLLHHIDNLDSKMACMRATVERDRFVEGCWTGYSSALERSVLKKNRFLDETEPPLRARAASVSEVTPLAEARGSAIVSEPQDAENVVRDLPPKPAPGPVPRAPHQTIFGEKLKSALAGSSVDGATDTRS